jgi:signal transduction histidine kinase
MLLWDEQSELLLPTAAFGFDLGLLGDVGVRSGESVLGIVFDEGVSRLVSSSTEVADLLANLDAHNRRAIADALDKESIPRSMMIAPISIEERKFGILVLATIETKWMFTELDIPFIQSLTELFALAIQRSRLEDISFAVREAARADKLKSEVMATLSHELRTPLTAIKGYSTALLLDDISWPEEKRSEFLQMIDTECENLQTMINDILDSSLIDVGELAIEPQPIRMERLVQDIADDMQRRTDIHKLFVDFPEEYPIIDADPRRITQVLRNILDNAIKYSPNGGLVVVRGEVRTNDIVISIADQGVGISAEDLIPLFDKYFRVKAATGYHVAGTGLGLPVARSIVEAHNGRIWAESKVDQGTTLYFSLPLGGLSSSLP